MKETEYIWRAREQEHPSTHSSVCQLQKVFTDTRGESAGGRGIECHINLTYPAVHIPVFSVSYFIYIIVDDICTLRCDRVQRNGCTREGDY